LLRDHAAIARNHEVLDTEVVPELLHLRDERLGVARIAIVHGDRDGTALARREQAVVHLELVPGAVAVVTELCERTRRALEVAGAEVIEHQAVLVEMTGRELLLDGRLTFE